MNATDVTGVAGPHRASGPARPDGAAPAAVLVRRTPVGVLTVEPVRPDRDATVVRAWLAHPASAWWQMGELDVDEVHAYLAGLDGDDHQQAWLVRRDGDAVALVETYDPARVLLADVPAVRPGDVGMHLLVAPPPEDPAARVHGLTAAVMATAVRLVLDHLGAARVVVEPDVGNTAVAAKNAEVGFRVVGEVELPGKRASLAVLTRDDAAAAHLAPGPMAAAQRHLVAKAIAEFTHERLVAPVLVADAASRAGAGSAGVPAPPDPRDGSYELVAHHLGSTVVHRFRARRHELEHLVVDEPTLTRTVDGVPAPLDALALVAELQPALGIPDALLATYLEELAATLAAAALKEHRGGPSAEQLVHAGFQEIEGAMTEGHPGFVANAGRIGFGVDDVHAYAPESGADVRLVWVAARRDHAHVALGRGIDERAHLEAQLGPDLLARFAATLGGHGLDPDHYALLPLHPWQWQHRVAVTFAPDVARRDLVLLGEGDARHRPQQSIRTFADVDRPDRDYVKTALAIQNMGFLRGLSPAYMRHTPAINDWVHDVVSTDATLREARFRVLREHVTTGWTGDAYHRTATPSAHRKMLAALWRESAVPQLAPGERLATMASLLHRDAAGRSLAAALVRASGLAAEDWLRRYLHAYLRPVVHCLRQHDLAFMPHGENVVLVLEGAVVTGAFMKDVGEEVVVVRERDVPDDVRRIVHPVPDAERALAVFTDVFDGVLRHLVAILDDEGVLPSARAWRLVAECVDRHEDEHPDLAGALDLRVDRFDHSCLNRLQLRDTLQMVDLADQSSSLLYAGTLANPVARSRRW